MIPFILAISYICFHPLMQKTLDINSDVYYTNRISKNKKSQKVYDVSHLYMPDLQKYHWISDCVTLLFLVPLIFYPSMLFEYILFFIPLFITRSIVNRLTVLPKNKSCKPSNITMFIGGCYDKIYSGHFASVLLATLLYYKYNLINLNIIYIVNIINGILILLTRGHYTVDIYVALVTTLLFYQNNIKLTF
jgi:hypothetical protein